MFHKFNIIAFFTTLIFSLTSLGITVTIKNTRTRRLNIYKYDPNAWTMKYTKLIEVPGNSEVTLRYDPIERILSYKNEWETTFEEGTKPTVFYQSEGAKQAPVSKAWGYLTGQTIQPLYGKRYEEDLPLEKCPEQEEECLLVFDRTFDEEGVHHSYDFFTLDDLLQNDLFNENVFPLIIQIEEKPLQAVLNKPQLASITIFGFDRLSMNDSLVECLNVYNSNMNIQEVGSKGNSLSIPLCKFDPAPEGDEGGVKLQLSSVKRINVPNITYNGDEGLDALMSISNDYITLTTEQRDIIAQRINVDDIETAQEVFDILVDIPGAESVYQALELKKVIDNKKDSINILVVGDQGKPDGNIWHVANSLTNVCKNIDCDFGISAGDNVYPKGPKFSEDSEEWVRVLQNHFNEPLNPLFAYKKIPFFMSLGNHDIGVDISFLNPDVNILSYSEFDEKDFINERISRINAQVHYTKKSPFSTGELDEELKIWNMPGSYYHKVVDHKGMKILLVALDTSYFPRSIGGDPEKYDNENIDFTPTVENKQQEWLLNVLDQNQDVDFKLIFGHHALQSSAKHGSARKTPLFGLTWSNYEVEFTTRLRESLLPILCENNIDAYLTGHDHVLSLDKLECEENNRDIPQVLSGATSKSDGHEISNNQHFWENSTSTLWMNGVRECNGRFDGSTVDDMFGFFTLELKKDGENKSLIIEAFESTPKKTRNIGRWNVLNQGPIEDLFVQENMY